MKRHFALILFLFCIQSNLWAQPAGFTDQVYVDGMNQATGIAFDANGRMYVWEKSGKVWIVENGVKNANPLIDISEEVGNWRDFGLVGFALDPNFLNNGHIYLLYIVDRHHLLNFGTSAYDAGTNEYFDATIGRITRYTANASDNFNSIDYNTRNVLFGETASTGMPSLHQSHGTGSLVFGTDGTLLATLGDGASYSSRDEGSASETYYQNGLDDNIIRADENVGAYRCQKNNSFNGKIIRIDPETGDGIPSNPLYNSNNPRSAASRTWAKGVRNPYKICLRPETGSHDPEDGEPGTFYFGDVGWGTREELNVCKAPGQNFGWPKFEGMTAMPGYNNGTYNPSTHELPKVDWRRNTARVYVNNNIYNIGSIQFPGNSFNGNASTGGIWYTGDDFPPEYKNTYFHADYGNPWVKNFVFDENDNPVEIRDFLSNTGPVVAMSTSPVEGGLFYVNYPNEIRKVSYVGDLNQAPVAVIESDVNYGTQPLTVQFTGDNSFDPEGGQLTYAWDFGDNTITSTEPNPRHIFSSAPTTLTQYNVTLTVTDPAGESSTKTIAISLNNTPPQIVSTSIDNRNTFSTNNATIIQLSAVVNDAEHNQSELSYEWTTALYHNNHHHDEPVDMNPATNTRLSPIGCDGATYWYRITLKVTDPEGLSATYTKDIYPNCSGNNQTISFSSISDKTTSSAPFNLTASSSSGLPVALYVVEGPALISGNQVTLSGKVGQVRVRAVQGGDATYKPARAVERTFFVSSPVSNGCSDGRITREVWLNIPGNDLSSVPFNTTPDETTFPTIFESPSGVAEEYGSRLRGYICPPQNGDYIFWVSSDDASELWLSTDDNPNNKVKIAQVDTYTSSRQWNKFASQESAPINLNAGERYYVEVIHKEGISGDHLAVGWELPNGNRQRPIPGNRIASWDGGTVVSRPAVSLSTSELNVTGPFDVVVNFSENITGLSINDFTIANGIGSNLSGSGQIYTFTVTPASNGTVTVRLPANRTTDATGDRNTASNLLTLNYTQVITCDNVTSGGTISGNQSNCGAYDPGNISNTAAASGGSGTLQYRWQRSTTSETGPWTSISGATNQSYNPPSISETTWYRRSARRAGCSNYARSSNIVRKRVETDCGGTNPPTGYCASRGTSPWTEWIANVNFGDIDQNSGKDGYGNYTALSTDVNQGGVYPITLTPGLSWPGHRADCHWRVWIDLNRDGDFNDSGEKVFEDHAISIPVNGNIIIPSGASIGATRMRVSMHKNEYANPCEVFDFGEVEDYLVNITTGSGSGCFINASVDNIQCDNNGTQNNVSDDTYTFEVTVTGTGTAPGWTAGPIPNAFGSGNYGQAVSFGPYPISSGDINLTITDDDDNTCTTSITADAPSPCSTGANPPTDYCTSGSTSPWTEWIGQVTFRDIDNTSGKSFYTDYTSQRTSAIKGATYPVELRPGLSWPGHVADCYWRVWIDFNRDGDFSDSGEKVFEDHAISVAVNGNISIPANASAGPTRMRVSMQRDEYAMPCETFAPGEVEDYTIDLVNNDGGDITPPTVTLGRSSAVVNGNFNITADFSEDVSGLIASDFSISNGSAISLNGSGSSYTLRIDPGNSGDVTINLPANQANDVAGNGNIVSNTVSVFYDPPMVPTVVIDAPANGSTITGTDVEVEYTITNVVEGGPNDHLLLTLDGDAPIDIHDRTVNYIFNNVQAGSHTLTAQLADASHVPLTNPEASYTVNFTTTNEPVNTNYCNSRGTAPWTEWIERVEFAGIDSETFKEQYGDYTSITTTVEKGNNYPIDLTPGLSWPGHITDAHWRVWIDFNQDGDFTDAGEKVLEDHEVSAVLSGTISIPTNASTGTTRMRISMQNDAYSDPCETFGRGEVEDYSVNIQAAGNNPVVANGSGNLVNSHRTAEDIDIELFPNPSKGILYIRGNTIEQELSLQVFNAVGQVVLNDNRLILDTNGSQLDMRHLPTGVYYLSLRSEDGQMTSRRFVISR